MEHVDEREHDPSADHPNLGDRDEKEPDRAGLLRALRDLEAAKARVERDARAVHDETRRALVIQLLPVLDNLDRSIRVADEAGDTPGFVEGVRLVRAQLEGVLRGYGVERISSETRRFDPMLHDAVSALPVIDPRANGLIVEEVEAGYRFGDTLLRPAKVVVAKYTEPRASTFGWH